MNDAQIQIQFPISGAWDKFTLTAVYADADGFVQTRRCTEEDIPEDHVPALAAVVSALVGMGEPWQASQVWAMLNEAYADCPSGEEEMMPKSAQEVALTVEAVNEQGGRRVFTSEDYSEFILTNAETVTFFKSLTTGLRQ